MNSDRFPEIEVIVDDKPASRTLPKIAISALVVVATFFGFVALSTLRTEGPLDLNARIFRGLQAGFIIYQVDLTLHYS